MSRDQLLDIASRIFDWTNIRSADADPSILSTFVAEDLVIKIPFPGVTPDLAGFAMYKKKAHDASSDFKITIREVVVDETESRVVHFFQCSGTHDR